MASVSLLHIALFGSESVESAEVQRARRLSGEEGELGEAPPSLEALAAPPEFLSSLSTVFSYAALTRREARALVVIALCAVLATILLYAAVRMPAVFLVPAVVLYGEYRWLRRQAYLRAERFERDFTALLLSLASSVRTGQDPLTALLEAHELFPARSEVAKELATVRQSIERGATEDEAVRLFGASIEHPDVSLFQTAFIISRREGASLAQCLLRLARVTRNRQSFRRKVRASVAMQKLSSIGIAGCAVVIMLIQTVTNWDGVRTAIAHPVGSKLLVLGSFLVVTGLVWMMKLSRARI